MGTLLPWLGVDGATRSSYELASLVDRLGLAAGSPAGLLLRLWPVVPVAVAVSSVLALLSHDAAARVVALLAACVVLVGCAVAWSTPSPARPGVLLSLVGALALAAAALLPRRVLR